MSSKEMSLAAAYRVQYSKNKKTARRAKAVIKAHKKEKRLKNANK